MQNQLCSKYQSMTNGKQNMHASNSSQLISDFSLIAIVLRYITQINFSLLFRSLEESTVTLVLAKNLDHMPPVSIYYTSFV